MYKKHLLNKGFNLENLTSSEKIELNQILDLERKYRNLLSGDAPEIELTELEQMLSDKKELFESYLSKAQSDPKPPKKEDEKVVVVVDEEPKENKSSGFFGFLAVVGTIAIGALLIIGGVKPPSDE